jgi:hypothetical protein
MNQIIEATDEIIFHAVYVSGYRFTVLNDSRFPQIIDNSLQTPSS